MGILVALPEIIIEIAEVAAEAAAAAAEAAADSGARRRLYSYAVLEDRNRFLE
jgi:hypothetical protein